MENGFAVRPTDPDALKHWTEAMSRVKKYLATQPELSPLCSDPSTVASQGTPTVSANWAGMWDYLGQEDTYSNVSGTFKQPTFVSGCPTRSTHAVWVGLGSGKVGEGLFQTGTDNVDGLNTINAWWQVVQGQWSSDREVIPMTIASGATITPVVNYNSEVPLATFRVTNDNTGESKGYQLEGFMFGSTFHPVSDYYSGKTAEAVDERVSDKTTGLPTLFTETTGPTEWGGITVNGVDPDTYTWQEIDMWTNHDPVAGTLLGYPTFPSASNFRMSTEWRNCGS